MSRRPPAPPPDLPDHTVVKLLGSGGFADVYLYEQHLPRRSVAVKVLLPGAADGETLAQFDAEANLMAALSTHPAIVTIHQAGVSGDGRPFMVMEYCSRPNLSARYRAERLSVADVLRIGVRLAGAVETAHRAGILHRDIKPANVLTTDFGHAVLSDFGISVQSSTHGATHGRAPGPAVPGAAVGMSIPWTAPEVFAEQTGGDERADVYSLAATLYTVLARRSPFDRPGGPNASTDLINRIRTSPLPALVRTDVPPSLERVIARAMDKNPAARYSSALELARALQQVEGELRLAPTPIDVLDEHPAQAAEELGDQPATRIRALTVIEPEPGSRARVAGPPPAEFPRYDAPSAFTPAGPFAAGPQQDEHTMLRGGLPAPPGPPGTAGSRRSWIPAAIGVGVAVLVAVVVVVLLTTRGTDPGAAPVTTDRIAVPTVGALADPPDPVTGLKARLVDGRAVFRWTNPDPRADDRFQWVRTDVPEATAVDTREATVTITEQARDACITVKVVRDNGASSNGNSVCVEG